ncbi:hypothetical protein CANCADRAFT_146120 [Tortispora caseinolytica NRRL Y-17796]|uniref:Oxidase FUB9 n=1 Tax=Tortispora caseinolytica NRRL Y-17796 TaxID=767744 RepID=A0A1E4T9K5_9ASCO|nr:hypothetical protein CANCADRAFT_146120 [Tortispora caseinolytica NRRL Y-17796]
MSVTKMIELREYEDYAEKNAPKMFRDYWTGGAERLETVAENINAFSRYLVRPRVMQGVKHLDTRSKPLFGKQYALPIGIAPSGTQKIAHPDGEIATTRAAVAKNWAMGVSSYSNCSLEECREACGSTDHLVFLQLYVFENRKTTEKLIRKAEKAGYKALLLTVDTPFFGHRHSEIRNKFVMPKHLKLGNFEDGEVANAIEVALKEKNTEGPDGVRTRASTDANRFDPNMTWEETIPWLKSITNLEIWAKGVTTAEDAIDAVNAGIDGIWVSNHGGRQLDSAISTIDALPEVVAAVNGRIPVHLDGGVRRGLDAYKAIALGADFVWVGRPIVWGLFYDGQQGAENICEILETEFFHAMAQSGCRNVGEITKDRLVRRGPALERL